MDSRRPQEEDLARAYFCSEAVLLEKEEEIEEFLIETKSKFPIIQFDVVHVSLDQKNDLRGFKFLVAYAADATFIAFRGSRTFEDLGLESQRSSASEVHGVVLELSHSFMGSGCNLLAQLYGSGKRIIFCGQRLGGSVAHMVVVRFCKDCEVKVEDLEPNTMISFAFGAPNICGYERAQEINDNAHMKVHFFNVTDDSDPVASLQDELEGREVQGDTAVRSGRFPIGNTVQLPSGWHHTCPSSDMGSPISGEIKPWCRKKFSDSYKSAVIAACKLCASDEDDDSPKTKVESPAPRVTSAKWKASDFQIFITIKGYNLLFLCGPVKLNGVRPWKTIVLQTDVELVITAPDNTRAEDIEAVFMVNVETAFGETSQVVQQDIGGDTTESPLKVLPRIVQTFFVLARPPFCILPSRETLDNLDSIIRCVPGLKDTKFSERLKAIANFGVRDDVYKGSISEMNQITHSVIGFLSRSYNLQIAKKEQALRVIGCVVGCILVAVGVCMLPTAAMASPGIMNTGGQIMMLALGEGDYIVRAYTEMLQLAIHEASLWPIMNFENIQELNLPTTTALESLLQAKVERSGSHLESMIEKIHKPGEENIELSSEEMQAATVESKHNLVRRVYIVAKTLAIYNKEVKSCEFLGIVGAEDSGKSTFIKKAIRRFGENPSGDVPEVGFKCHTTTVRPYKVKGSLYLVDFPGSDGTENYAKGWKQFTSLTSSCILLLEFKGDLKKYQMKMYKKKKRDLDSKVAVVFNKMDLLFSDSDEDKIDAAYLEEHRVKAAGKLGCNSEDVHYVCLEPKNKQTLTELQKIGVLDFEGLAKKIGGWLAMHSTSGAHHILME